MYKRGDFYYHGKHRVKILGPEDFDGYEYNYPGDKWELVEFSAGKKKWVVRRDLTHV